MCGIAGLYSPSYPLWNIGDGAEIVRCMTQSFMHRGPDADGLWIDQNYRCILGHRRLSIIDISDAGRQPMISASGRWVISFNGEIYNFEDIRRELQAKSVTLKGRTDTEVLLESIALWGVEVFNKLDGMYAFAAFDTLTGEMLLARDPFGEKPLYFMKLKGGGLAFASELQALEEIPGFNKTVDPNALAEVLMFQYIGAPRSIYKEVQKLPPGHWMRLVPDRDPEYKRFFAFEPGKHDYRTEPMAQLADELEDILVRSLQRRLVSDVPLGAFLSGGVDSSTVCALARRKLGIPLKTFSIGFSGDTESEHEIARKFSEHLGTQHHDKIISPSAVDFLNHTGTLLDEPNADSSCLPTYYLSEFARQHVTVALSGDGGDELFGGYGRYLNILEESAANKTQRNFPWSPGRSYYYSNRIMVFSPEQLGDLFGFIPGGCAEHVKHLIGEVDQEGIPLLHRLRSSDVANYMPGAVLPKVDRMSMRHSLEVRTPFLNMELARFAERLPAHFLVGQGYGKLLLREIAYRYLPREMIDLPKKGFGLPVTADWGKSHLVNALGHTLGEDSPLGNWFGAERAEKFFNLQASENGFSIYQTWSVIMLDKWLRNRPANLPEIEKFSTVSQKNIANYYLTSSINLVRMVGFITPSVIVVSSPLADTPEKDVNIKMQLSIEDYQLLKVFEKKLSIFQNIKIPLKTFLVDPAWNLSKCIQKTDFKIAGCTIISLDRDNQWIDLNDIQNLRSQGLGALVMPAPYSDNRSWLYYFFNHHGLIKRFINILHLLPHSKSIWLSKKSSAHKGGSQIKKLKQLVTEKDHESSLDYALFEGPSQFLPLISSHREISDSMERRYSIWNQCVYYSGRHQLRSLYLRPLFFVNWVVPINNKTRNFLPSYAKLIKIDCSEDAQDLFENALINLVENTNQFQLEIEHPSCFVLYTHGLSAGGAERQWCNLAIGLKEIGKHVYFVVDSHTDVNSHYLYLLINADVEVLQVVEEKEYKYLYRDDCDNQIPLLFPSSPPGGIGVSRLATALDRLKPDVLVAQLDNPNISGAIAGLLVGIPKIVLSFRNYNPTHFDYLNQPWLLPTYKILARSKRIILTGNSRLGNLDYAKWIGIDESRIKLLRNAYQPDSSNPLSDLEKLEFRDELGISAQKKIIFGAFRLSREKNPQVFVDTCARVLMQNPNTLALLCGEGKMYVELEKNIKRIGLSDRIWLLGRRSDIWKFLCIADVLLLTSEFEGTPNIVVEALMLGCPVVSTACGAVPELIKEGVNGHITPLGDVKALAMCVEQILFDEKHRKKLTQHITNNKNHFTPSDKANLLMRIICEVTEHGQVTE